MIIYRFIALCFCIFFEKKTTSFGQSRSQFSNPQFNNFCRFDQFLCNSLQCIPEENQCDGIEDCRDGSDEVGCEIIRCNPTYLFQCNYGACITRRALCDGKKDCRDNSDESPSLCNYLRPTRRPRPPSICGIQNFTCSSLECISEEDQCDGKPDCPDGSDETEVCMIIPCNTRYLFQCTYGACISRKLVCDGKPDCMDGSDELPRYCSSLASMTQKYPEDTVQCSPNQFRCSSSQCVDEEFLCDGKSQCLDKSDETASVCSAMMCPRLTFRCNYGACVRLNARCNGRIDCADGSDEDLCPTNPSATTTAPPPMRTHCLIPENPANGNYANSGQTVTNNEQSFAVPLSILIVNCDQGFNSNPPETFYSICRDGAWTPNPPICSQTCTPLNLSGNSNVRCEFGNKSLQSCDNAVDGVTALVACVTSSNNTSVPENCVFVCNAGKWELVTNFQITNEFSLSSNKTLSFNVTVYPVRNGQN